MTETILLGLFSVIFAYLAKYNNIRWGLKVSFFLIFLFLALRYNFGNDYQAYFNAFTEIGRNSQINFFDKAQQFEPGWVFINWLFRPFGFFALTAALALINCLIYYQFIKKYVPVEYYWLSTFLYVFNPEFMLIHSSAMRQSVAIMLFVFSLDYLHEKKALRYFLCIGLASLFHFSALILLPVYLVGFYKREISSLFKGLIVSLYISLFLFGTSVLPLLKQFISAYFEKYSIYQTAGAASTGLGFAYLFAMLILTLYFEKYQNSKTAIIFKIAVINFIFMPLNLLILLIARVRMYFAPATLIVYPIILLSIKKPLGKAIFLTFLLVFTLYGFFQFFYSETWKEYFRIYQTIFAAPQF
jgi:hypothetical protein